MAIKKEGGDFERGGAADTKFVADTGAVVVAVVAANRCKIDLTFCAPAAGWMDKSMYQLGIPADFLEIRRKGQKNILGED